MIYYKLSITTQSHNNIYYPRIDFFYRTNHLVILVPVIQDISYKIIHLCHISCLNICFYIQTSTHSTAHTKHKLRLMTWYPIVETYNSFPAPSTSPHLSQLHLYCLLITSLNIIKYCIQDKYVIRNIAIISFAYITMS